MDTEATMIYEYVVNWFFFSSQLLLLLLNLILSLSVSWCLIFLFVFVHTISIESWTYCFPQSVHCSHFAVLSLFFFPPLRLHSLSFFIVIFRFFFLSFFICLMFCTCAYEQRVKEEKKHKFTFTPVISIYMPIYEVKQISQSNLLKQQSKKTKRQKEMKWTANICLN